jgi:hypothetical protein
MEDHWVGPFNVKVPLKYNSVRSSFYPNHVNKNGCETEMPVQKHMDKEEYLQTYAELKDDGCFWYKGDN